MTFASNVLVPLNLIRVLSKYLIGMHLLSYTEVVQKQANFLFPFQVRDFLGIAICST